MLHPVLLVPGPVNLSLRVQEALRRSPLSPWQSEYQALHQQLLAGLLTVYAMPQDQWEAVLLSGCAVHATMAMLRTAVNRAAGQPLGVVVQGPLGERAVGYLRQCNCAYESLALAPGQPLNAAVLGGWLDRHPQVKQLVLVHCEPASGLVNDFQALAPACRERDVHWLVDASASFGAEIIDIQHWPVMALAAATDACLHGASGLAFVVAQHGLIPGPPDSDEYSGQTIGERIGAAWTAPDLAAWRRPWAWGGYWPSALMYALAEALRELHDNGGWAARRRRYYRIQESTARLLKRYGVDGVPPAGMLAAGVRCYRLPALLRTGDFAQQLLRQGYVVDTQLAAGHGRPCAAGEALADRPAATPSGTAIADWVVADTDGPDTCDTVTMATMGDLDELQVSRLHQALEDILHPVTIHVEA